MNDLIQMVGPIVVHSFNPYDVRDRKVFQAEGGLSIRQMRPDTTRPLVIMWNGNYVLPEDEDYVPQGGEQLLYLALPLGGGNGSQAILGAILIVVGIVIDVVTFGTLGNYFIAAGIGLLISGLAPTPKTAGLQNSLAASPTYNISVSGNQARIGQSIPVLYGRHILLPDFAAQPYIEYDSAGDQYYFAIMCLGQLTAGQYTLESIQIDDTDLSHFVDVSTMLGNVFLSPNDPLFGPGLPPTGLVDPTVVTNTAVADNVLAYDSVVGPFAICGPGLVARYIGIDIICAKGLYYANDSGGLDAVTVHWMVEARPIDDYNSPIGPWSLLGTESLTGANSTPIRRSFKYGVPVVGRYEVRVHRLEAEQTDSRYGDEVQWTGLRAYLAMTAQMEPTATYLQLKIKADSQLSGLSQRQISVTIQRWLPTWNPDTGWSAPVYTRNPAWEAVDVLRNTDYGPAVPDSRLDLASYYQLSRTCNVRGDTCNIVFDTRITPWAAQQSILATCRARPIMRGSVFTVVRDEEQDLPVAMFTMRNISKGSFKMGFTMVNEDTTDGIEMEFFNEQTWNTDYVRFPLPGFTESIDPSSISVTGITSKIQAQRETLYMVSDVAYRRTSITFDTELEGYLPAFGDLIAVSHDVPSWGMSGEFDQWDGTTARCTEDIVWAVGPNYVMLINKQGDPVGPVLVTQGIGVRTMLFPSGYETSINIDTDYDRTRYAFGPATSYAKMCRIINILPGETTVSITAVVEDNRVHDADAAYLPATPGDPDGGTGTGGSGGGGTGTIPGGGRVAKYTADGLPTYDAASDAQRAANGFYANDDGTVGTTHDTGYVYGH